MIFDVLFTIGKEPRVAPKASEVERLLPAKVKKPRFLIPNQIPFVVSCGGERSSIIPYYHLPL